MVSVKALGATALTLMIAIPILLGYGLASTEETTTAWEVESTANITDLLYNYNSVYTAEYMNPYNNKELLTYDGSSWSIVAPNYSTVGSTYTSIPEYTSSTGTIALTSSTRTYYDLTSSTLGSSGSGADTVLTSPYVFVGNTSVIGGDLDTYFDGVQYTDNALGGIYALYGEDGVWEIVLITASDVLYYGEVTQWYVTGTDTANVRIRDYTEIDPDVESDISYTTSERASFKIVTSSGTEYLAVTDNTSVVKTTSGNVTIGDYTYSNVTALYDAENYSTTSITYTYTMASTSSYVDPADGWTITGATSQWWLNGQSNDSVRFMVSLDSGESCTLGPALSATTAALVGLAYDGDTLTVTDYTASASTDLGNYSYAMVVLTKTEATVYGLSSWPTLGVWPTTYNYTTVDYNDLDDTFPYVYMSGDCEFRVDLADVVAGTYPSTSEFQFYPDYYYPDKSVIFTFKSIALYGNDINILSHDDGTEVGTVFNITNGTATVNDVTFKLLKSQIKILENSDGTWTTYFGGQEVMTTDEPTSIYFGGEWSLTASMSLLTETTSTQQVWSPGTFAFDKEDFAACGLIVAGICLVGLGMNGARSGTKMGILLMVCGGGALIYLTLI